MLRDLSWLICGIFTLCLFVCLALVSPTRSTFPNGTIKSASCYLLISFRDYECCGGLTLGRKCPGSIFHLWLFIGIAQELHWSCTKMTISVLKVSRPGKNKDLKPMALTSTISWYICTLWPSSSFCLSQFIVLDIWMSTWNVYHAPLRAYIPTSWDCLDALRWHAMPTFLRNMRLNCQILTCN